VTRRAADLGSCPASHRSVRAVFSPICHSSATGCEGHADLAGRDHRLEPSAVTESQRWRATALRVSAPAESVQPELRPIAALESLILSVRSPRTKSGPMVGLAHVTTRRACVAWCVQAAARGRPARSRAAVACGSLTDVGLSMRDAPSLLRQTGELIARACPSGLAPAGCRESKRSGPRLARARRLSRRRRCGTTAANSGETVRPSPRYRCR